MAVTVTPLFSFDDRDGSDLSRPAIDRDETSAQIEPLKFLVTGLDPGMDATKQTGIPQRGSQFSVDGTTFIVDRVSTQKLIADGSPTFSAFVQALCSTDGRFRFPVRPVLPEIGGWDIETSFRVETRTAPTFVTREIIIPQDSGAEIGSLEWVQEPIQYTVNVAVLQVSTTIEEPVSKADFLEMYRLAKAQNDFLHRFLDEYWRFTPPHMSRSAQGQVSIVYTWESDPGNWEIGSTIGNGTAPGHRLAAPPRPPFTEYVVNGSGEFGLPPPPPEVALIDLYPDQDNNEYVDLDGWQDLPGNPLG